MAMRERKKIVITIRKKAEKQQPPLSSSQQISLAITSKDAGSDPPPRDEEAASGKSCGSGPPRLVRRGSASDNGGQQAVGAATTTEDEDETLASELCRTQQARRQEQQQREHEQRPPKRRRGQGGLPTFSVRPMPSNAGKHEKGLASALDVDKVKAAASEFDSDEEEELPCETMMVLTSLLNDPFKRVAVPILGSGGQIVYGASPLHLYAALDGRDPVVMGELRTLLQSDVVCKLRLPPQHVGAHSSSSSGATAAPAVVVSDPHHHLLVLKSEYRRAAYQSVLPELDPERSSLLDGLGSRAEAGAAQLQHIVEWFLDESNVVDTISEQELEEKLRKPTARCLPTAAAMLSKLQGLQLLRSLPAPTPNRGRTVFQLWLPSWGLVVRAWDKAATNLVAHLRRSQYKERSHRSLVAPQRSNRSPIPADLVVEHLVSQGIVVKVERPAGTFVRLVGH